MQYSKGLRLPIYILYLGLLKPGIHYMRGGRANHTAEARVVPFSIFLGRSTKTRHLIGTICYPTSLVSAHNIVNFLPLHKFKELIVCPKSRSVSSLVVP